jgi:putative adhesin
MNTRTRSHYLLTAATALLAMSCAVREKRSYTVERTFPASALQRVEIREVDGSLKVEAGSDDKITLVANIRSRELPKKGADQNYGFFTAQIEGDSLSITRVRQTRKVLFWDSNDLTINYSLRVPQRLALDLNTVNGRIATTGIGGATQVTTVNGPIELEASGLNEVSARTVNGRVRAKFLQTFQGASLKTVNGDVETVLPKSASFVCDLTQVNGDFEASFPLSIHSNPGSRRVSGEVNGGRYELKISTVNGDIDVQNGGGPAAPAVLPAPPAAAPPAIPSAPPVPPAPPASPSVDAK